MMVNNQLHRQIIQVNHPFLSDQLERSVLMWSVMFVDVRTILSVRVQSAIGCDASMTFSIV